MIAYLEKVLEAGQLAKIMSNAGSLDDTDQKLLEGLRDEYDKYMSDTENKDMTFYAWIRKRITDQK